MVGLTVISNSRSIRETIHYRCNLCNNDYEVSTEYDNYDSLPDLIEQHFLECHTPSEILKFLVKSMFDRFEIKTTKYHNNCDQGKITEKDLTSIL